MAKCPHCEEFILTINVMPIDASGPGGKKWKSAIFSCGRCHKVIGTSFDAALQTEVIVAAINAK